MKKKVIEFVIGYNGSIRSTVKEIKGGGCEKVSDSLKHGLGKVTAAKRTSEYYQNVDTMVSVYGSKKNYQDR